LQVDLSIISRDVDHLRQEAKYNIKRYIDERLPEEYEKCRIGLNAITKEAWSTLSIPTELYSRQKTREERYRSLKHSKKTDLTTRK
jgi:hypothetical protein